MSEQEAEARRLTAAGREFERRWEEVSDALAKAEQELWLAKDEADAMCKYAEAAEQERDEFRELLEACEREQSEKAAQALDAFRAVVARERKLLETLTAIRRASDDPWAKDKADAALQATQEDGELADGLPDTHYETQEDGAA